MNSKIGKIAFFVIGIILVGAFSAFLVNKNMHDPRLNPPAISFASEKIDLGDVKQGPQVTGEFEFTNTGKNVLVISNVSTSCGCTGVVSDEKKEYQPGEKGKIKFTFNTEGRHGVNEKSLTVYSNDPNNPTKSVSFTCNIITN
jgi:hypothetical protein